MWKPNQLAYNADRPFLSFSGKAMFPMAHHKAAALMEGLIRDHCFEGANKRTAFTAAAALMLLVSGRELDVSSDEAERVVLAVEAREMNLEDLAAWFDENSY